MPQMLIVCGKKIGLSIGRKEGHKQVYLNVSYEGRYKRINVTPFLTGERLDDEEVALLFLEVIKAARLAFDPYEKYIARIERPTVEDNRNYSRSAIYKEHLDTLGISTQEAHTIIHEMSRYYNHREKTP